MSDTVFYFKKLAKAFLNDVEALTPAACMRVRAVYRDTASVPDEGIATHFTLMRAQHVIAVEHGFKSWEDLLGRRQIELQLAITLVKNPDLDDAGMGLSREDRQKPLETQSAILRKERADIWSRIEAIELAVLWLKDKVKPTKRMTPNRSSYGTKHVAEPDIGYISNGAWIAALLIAGFTIKRNHGSINTQVGLSERSLRAIEDERRKNRKPYGWMRPQRASLQQ